MGEYWGAKVTALPAGAVPHARTRYADVQQNFDYTKPAGSTGADDIEMINRKIMNQHPEDISLLADRWQNAHDLLVSIRAQLLLQGGLLEREWRESRARDIFLERGPGETLAYLDDWIEATLSNKEALRALVTIAEDSRTRMQEIWADYQRDIAAARDLSTWDEIKEDLQIWQGWKASLSRSTGMVGVSRDTGEAKEQAAREAVNAVHERYNRIAQAHASGVASRYAETFTKIGEGHGALFEPMNVVFNPPHPPFPALPGAPPGAPSVAPPGAPAGVPTAPPVPPAARLFHPVVPPVEMIARPDVSVAVPSPAAVPTPPAVPAAPVPPGMAVPPVPAPPGVPVPTVAGPVTGVPVTRPSVGPGALPPGAPPQPSALPPGAPRPGVHNGVLKAGNAPAAPPSLPPNMPQPGRTIGRAPTAPDTEEPARPVTGRPTDSESAFSGPPPPASPVLGNPRQPPARPGHRERPPLTGPRRTDPPAPGAPAGAVPPVLNAPSPPQATPPRQSPARRGTPGAPVPPGSEWVGAGTARDRASGPVLGRPHTPTGQPASRLEEVPERLRGHAARQPTSGPAVPPELTPRRTVPEEPAPAEIRPDEEAFHLETPGGGVIGKQPERAVHRPEPPASLGRA
ncbi:hypothetical protein [Phytohabitans kaempferiae]|uniref:Uncharacterized protein n=1 Tax=Phytohabitans kaempferiae TaxID=1620943 RepID=A0ABV6M5D9_9ACTN